MGEHEIGQSLAKRYLGLPEILKMGLAALPGVGGPIAILFNQADTEFILKRIADLERLMVERLAILPPGSVDEEYQQSEEWLDLRLKAIEAAYKTRHREKIELYARILTGAVKIDGRAGHDPETYLDVLAEMSLIEVQLLKVYFEEQSGISLGEQNKLRSVRETGQKLSEKFAKDNAIDLHLISRRLTRTGLLREIFSGITMNDMDYEGGEFIITQALRDLMSFLQRNP